MMHNTIHVTRVFSTSITPKLNYLSSLFITWFDLLVQFSAHYKLISQFYCGSRIYFTVLCIDVFTVQLVVHELYCGL